MSPSPFPRQSPSRQELSGPGAATRPTEAAEGLGFDEVYRCWFSHVARWARALGGLESDVEDLCQEVFVIVRRRLPDFDGQNLGGWLYRITQRTVRDYRRTAWMRRLFLEPQHRLEEVRDVTADTSAHAQRQEAIHTLNGMLMRLSEEKRAAFVLYELEGYSGAEIAELQGVPLKTVYTRLHHARKDLTKLAARPRTLPTPSRRAPR